MLRAVVFDLDYTLAVPERDRTTILTDAVSRSGAPPLTREEYLDAHSRYLTSETREPIFADLLADRETDAEPAEVAREYRKSIANALEPVPEVETMLDSLREQYRVGLLTNGPVQAQRDKLATLGWERTFDAALVTGELEAGKPDMRAFEAICRELAVDPTDAVYVGDDVEADIYGATNAGMHAIQVMLPDGPTSSDRAIAHVEQETLAHELPHVLAAIEQSSPSADR